MTKGKRMSRKKKITLITSAAVLFVLAALAFAYVFVYDGLGLVGRLIGWKADLPEDMLLDRSMAQVYTTGENDYLYIRISRESSPYPDIREYIDYYYDRFYMSPDWRAANGAELLREETDGSKRIISLRVGNMPEGMPDTYTYVTVLTPTRYFLRALIKYDSRTGGQKAADAAARAAESLRPALSTGGLKLETDFRLETPADWTPETRAAFEKLASAETPYYGVFTGDLETLEGQLEHRFPLILTYFHLAEPLPLEKLERWYSEGRLTELTLQTTVTANDGLYVSSSPMIDLLAGKYDDRLEDIAAGLNAFGHPVLFRLNNEMNSDWTSYSGVVNLADPDLYVAVWRYIYDFFEARDVHNLIWIWNPNDRNFPPANWNSYMAYWPGNGCVQMLGITGYNTGTYYHDVTAEDWRDFTAIYDTLEMENGERFKDFPWIITEFASSSIGGDKPGWIRDMFAHMGDYERVKAAVWFDYADFDYSKPDAPVSRPYWIAENEDTLAAFKEGIADKAETFFDS